MRNMKKVLIASAVAMAVCGTAHGASVLFDINGAGGANTVGVDRFNVTVFDWVPGNLVIKDTTPILGVTPVNMYMQSALGSLSGPGTPAGTFSNLTYQLTLPTLAKAGLGAAGTIVTDYGPGGIGTLNIYYQGATVPNDITGCGYGVQVAAFCGAQGATSGTLIYSGRALLTNVANLTDTTVNIGSLDGAAPDVDSGVTTTGLGLNSMAVLVVTTFADPTFFVSPVGGIPLVIEHTETGGGVPFKTANPSDQVVAQEMDTTLAARIAAYGADLVNNTGPGSCGGVAFNPCDVHLLNDASSTVLAVLPEPGSLGMLGLGMAGLAFSLRRRTKRTAA